MCMPLTSEPPISCSVLFRSLSMTARFPFSPPATVKPCADAMLRGSNDSLLDRTVV